MVAPNKISIKITAEKFPQHIIIFCGDKLESGFYIKTDEGFGEEFFIYGEIAKEFRF
jgi:hypothetical protein